ncbi:unnamed protein product [Danaus chrysippus]|uniref:(African queen) hypothetical protein n=1 Tax=Danaus chrysippus TaxID=151541 RepID=A0A8J2QX12_9NEOP|nr:unnamed protein product [Danaus chrysippus]
MYAIIAMRHFHVLLRTVEIGREGVERMREVQGHEPWLSLTGGTVAATCLRGEDADCRIDQEPALCPHARPTSSWRPQSDP